ncbi:MAG: beta-hydroxyacyl-ACP dehydratase [Bacteroidaceae bacterium]|nr:beta-hydroxyacyl-ACP dehydratase [Bacteroidaceae bacterium]
MPNKRYDIQQLIPQRAPIIMVDELLEAAEDRAVCKFTIGADNYFLEPDGRLAEVALIEHIAQSASAFAGYRALQAGASQPPVGYIAEVKNFRPHFRPAVGDELLTTITMGAEVGGVSIIQGQTLTDERVVAETTMKIFVEK